MNGWKDGWINEWKDETDGYEWNDRQMGQMDGIGQMNRCIDGLF